MVNKQWVFLLFIFLINFLFKLVYIAEPSLWYDEIISVKDTLLDFGHIKHEAEWDKNPPFYHYVLWVWCKIFGISVFAVRSMSAFFSALTACLIYSFTTRVSDKSKGIFAVIVFTLHPYLFYYAQEARCYSMLIFLIMIDLFLLLRLVEKPSNVNAILLGMVNFLIFYTHYIAGIVLFCQFLYLLFIFKVNFKHLLLTYLTPVLLVLVRFTAKQYKVIFLSGESSRQKANVPLSSFDGLFNALPKLFFSNLIFIILLIMIIYFLYTQKDKIRSINSMLYFIFLTPFLSLFILFTLGFITNVFDARYLIFTTPFIVISMSQIFPTRSIAIGFLILIMCFELLELKFISSKKMDYKFAANLARDIEGKKKMPIYIQSEDVVTLFMYYYDFQAFKLYHNNEQLEKMNLSKGDLLKALNMTVINTASDIDIGQLSMKSSF